eukprot:12938128-Prorocentrum_lima.AAC.1
MFVPAIALQRSDVSQKSFISCPDLCCFLEIRTGLLIFETGGTHLAIGPDQTWMSFHLSPGGKFKQL